MPNWIVDLETTGLLAGYGQPRTDVGISEWALWSGKKYRGDFTDILTKALSSKLTPEEYYAQLLSGSPAWQEGIGVPRDVLAEVHERHLTATAQALRTGKGLTPEKQALKHIGDILAKGQSVGSWNIEFDFGVLEEVARRTGDKKFIRELNLAWTKGRIVEMSDPARKFLFNIAREEAQKVNPAFYLGQTAGTAKALAARPGTSPGQIAALTMQEMLEPHEGFRRLFNRRPKITYEQYKAKMASGGLEDLLGVQEFSEGLRRPQFRYVKGWRQHVLAQTISPGFLEDPTSTQLGQQIAKRLHLKQGEKVTAHLARDDTVLTGILHEIFSAKNPWKKLTAYGVKSKEQFITQYTSAIEQDLHLTLRTYLGEQSKQAMDIAYMRKVLSGAEELRIKAPDVARRAADPSLRFPGLRTTARGTLEEVMAASRKHPRIALATSIVGTMLLADAFIPQDNKLQGRRRSDSPYHTIGGINYGGMGAPATQALTDFGSGRSEDNAATQIRAWRLTRDSRPSEYHGYSIADIQGAMRIWGSAKSQTRRRVLERGEYDLRRAGAMSIPGVLPNAWVGVLDLKHYRVKAEDADTVTLYRRGLLHIFDKPISVRMAGIDAPESHAQWPFGKQPMGVESGEYLQTLIDQQQSISLVIDPNRTTYGRHVGVLSGDVHPNINLKLVSAGAAGALPSRRSITTTKAYERAETIAAASGLGMWSSKGWQAKRLLDLSVNQHVTNTTLQNIERLATKQELEETYHLVQRLHYSPKKGFWEEAELDALSQVMAMRQTARHWQVNADIKRHGWSRGIRSSISDWAIVTPGISPSELPGANVSAFGSGRDDDLAEDIQRRVDPIRRRYMPKAEPIMEPSRTKTASTTYVRSQRNKSAAAKSMQPRVGPRIQPVYKAQHIMYKRAMNKAASNVEASAAATSVGLTRRRTMQGPIQSFLGSMYSVPRAPWRALNEYSAIRSREFPRNWKVRAWSQFHAGSLDPADTARAYRELYEILREKGLGKESAANILKRERIPRALKRSFKNVVKSATGDMSWKRWSVMSAGSQWEGLYHGRVAALKNWADDFVAGQPLRWLEIKTALRDEFTIRKILWRDAIAARKSLSGKLGGFLEFFAYVGEPLAHEVPPSAAIGSMVKPHVGGLTKAKRWLIGDREIIGAKRFDEVKKFVSASSKWGAGLRNTAGPGLSKIGRGVGILGRRAITKMGGVVGVTLFTIPETIIGSKHYENRLLGAGVEFTAAAATWGTWAVTHGAIWAGAGIVGAAAGGWAGGIIGAAVGSLALGAGAPVGAALGAKIGAVIGKFAAIAAAEIAYGLILHQVIGEPIRYVGGKIAGKRNASPYMPEGAQFANNIPGMSPYGGTDQYLTAGHGIQSRPELSGFGGGLKILREQHAVSETLSLTSPNLPGAQAPQRPRRLSRPKSQLGPTAGLTNEVLWRGRHGITRGRSRWPVQWGKKPPQARHASGSRMMRAA